MLFHRATALAVFLSLAKVVSANGLSMAIGSTSNWGCSSSQRSSTPSTTLRFRLELALFKPPDKDYVSDPTASSRHPNPWLTEDKAFGRLHLPSERVGHAQDCESVSRSNIKTGEAGYEVMIVKKSVG
jgi:hypothetical protein